MAENKIINIIVIEDNPADAKLISEMLKEYNLQTFRITHVSRIKDALQKIGAFKFDAALLDLNLPDSYGLEGLEKIVSLHHEIPVIVLTSIDEENMGLEIMKRHAGDYLAKGKINSILLVRSINYAIERKKQEIQLYKLNRIYKSLSNSSQAMIRAEEELEYLNKTCRIVVEDCGYKMVWIGLTIDDDENKIVHPAASAGFDEGYIEKLNITWADTGLGRGPTGTAVRTGKPVVCRDMLNDPLFEPWREEALKRGYASSAVFPLKADGKVFGAINIYSPETDAFSDDDIKLFDELAGDISYAVMALRMRKALKESEKRFRSTMDNMMEGCQIIGKDWQYIYINASAEQHNRRPSNELIGRRYMDTWPGIEATHVFDMIRRCIEQRSSHNLENEFIFPDGSKGWFNLRIQPVPEGVFILSADITERKKAEEVLKRDKETLEKLVVERTTSMLDSQRELEKKNRLADIGALASTVAHELRNPLSGIRVANYNIRRKSKEGQDIEKHLVTIDRKIEDSNQIINDLLAYSKIRKPHFEKIKINTLLLGAKDDVLESFNLKQESIIFVEDAHASDTEIIADPIQLREVIHNVLNNSVQAIAAKEDGRIEIVGKTLDGTIELLIRDNGVGMDLETLNKIFEPFFTTKPKGTGLGMSVVKQIIDNHNGNIRIESTVGQGTSVFITLPKK